MRNPYQEAKNAQNYLFFLASKNGQIQQNALWGAILPRLPQNPGAAILDACCGNGWLAGRLINTGFDNIAGFDDSAILIAEAKKNFPSVEFKIADIKLPLPHKAGCFDAGILNMAAPDIENLPTAMNNLAQAIKTGGSLLLTAPHPEFTFPKAVWKRSLWDFLAGHKPSLRFFAVDGTKTVMREFGKKRIASRYYELADYLSACNKAGFQLCEKAEIRSKTDSAKFNLQYQLFRYPLLLLLLFKKMEKPDL